MGPPARGLGSAAAQPALDDARRWRVRLERAWGVTLHEIGHGTEPELVSFARELDEGLRLIAFPEVTVEDRIAFLEQAVVWQVRRALQAGRFDLALELHAQGARRANDLREHRHGWRPVLLHGTARPERPSAPPRAGAIARDAPRRPTR